jgi:MFS family permease
MSSRWTARLVVFVTFFDLFAQLPIIAPFAQQLGADPLFTSITVASYDVSNLFGNLAAGFVLLGLGKQRTLVIGLLVSGLALSLYGLVDTPLQLGLVRTLHGLGQAVLSPGAFTLLSDSVTAGRRAQAMGTAAAFIAIAAVIAPPLSGIVASRTEPEYVFAGIAGLMVVSAIIVAFFTSDTNREPFADTTGKRIRHGSVFSVMLRPQLVVAYGSCLAWTAGIGTLVVHLPLLLQARSVPASARGSAFAIYALVALVLFARPAPWLINRYGRLRTLGAGLVLIGASLVSLAFATGIGEVYGSMAIFGFGFGLLFPAATAYLADQTVPSERGTAYGVFYAAYSLGVVVGAVGSGQLAQTLGPTTVAPFWAFGSVAIAVGAWVMMLALRPSAARPTTGVMAGDPA